MAYEAPFTPHKKQRWQRKDLQEDKNSIHYYRSIPFLLRASRTTYQTSKKWLTRKADPLLKVWPPSPHPSSICFWTANTMLLTTHSRMPFAQQPNFTNKKPRSIQESANAILQFEHELSRHLNGGWMMAKRHDPLNNLFATFYQLSFSADYSSYIMCTLESKTHRLIMFLVENIRR